MLRLVVQFEFCSYLSEEWKEQNPGADPGGYFDETLFISAKVPQQDNQYDCGIFLLHYVELFLKVAPTSFSLKNIRNKEPNFVSMETISYILTHMCFCSTCQLLVMYIYYKLTFLLVGPSTAQKGLVQAI